jgi:hypothetical protein
MDVRFYPPPAQPAAAPAAPCLGPSPCLDPYYCNKVNTLLLSAPILAARSREGGSGGWTAMGPAGRTGPARRGPSRARSVAARGGAACARVVNIVEQLRGFAKQRDCAESDTICSDSFLPAVRH